MEKKKKVKKKSFWQKIIINLTKKLTILTKNPAKKKNIINLSNSLKNKMRKKMKLIKKKLIKLKKKKKKYKGKIKIKNYLTQIIKIKRNMELKKNEKLKANIKVKKQDKNLKQMEIGIDAKYGYTLYAIEDIIIKKNEKKCLNTGIRIQLPKDTYGLITNIEENIKKGLKVGAGIIDEDYRGEIKVILFNFGEKDYEIKKEGKIALMLIKETDKEQGKIRNEELLNKKQKKEDLILEKEKDVLIQKEKTIENENEEGKNKGKEKLRTKKNDEH